MSLPDSYGNGCADGTTCLDVGSLIPEEETARGGSGDATVGGGAGPTATSLLVLISPVAHF